MSRVSNPIDGRRRPLAIQVAAALALAGLAASCTATTVNSCLDDGSPGTLRYAVLTADEAGSVDMTGLQCSVITLQSGAINVDQDSLTITGPGAAKLVVDAGQNSRVFFHGGMGTLALNDMTIANGHIGGDKALGGCIYSRNSVGLAGSVVTGCTAQGVHYSGGAGVLAFNNLAMTGSIVENNLAETSAGTSATQSVIGGGVTVVGKLTMLESEISGNRAHAIGGYAFGGGAYVVSGVEAKYSTFDNNLADVAAFAPNYSIASGGALLLGRGAPTTTFNMRSCTVSHNRADAVAGMFLLGLDTDKSTIYNSTISMNKANYEGGGLAFVTRMSIFNSTIAFNAAGSYGGGGVVAEGDTLRLESTIIADNSPSGSMYAADLDGTAVLSGHNNLVKIVGSGMTLPTGTLRSDPHLGPLQDNGGPTRTQALMPDSPAIDAGNNTANFTYDQRLTGFKRVVGGAADIGAFEYDPDVIFVSGFQ